jgi:hypothetical protein
MPRATLSKPPLIPANAGTQSGRRCQIRVPPDWRSRPESCLGPGFRRDERQGEGPFVRFVRFVVKPPPAPDTAPAR